MKKPRRFWILGAVVTLFFAAVVTVACTILNPRLTAYVESDAFRLELEKQTTKGLHFPSGRFAPIRRTGFLTVATAGFQAEEGSKAMRTIDAQGVTAKFSPWGVWLRRWQLDYLTIDRGELGIQTYEPKPETTPEPSPAKPWYHFLLPQRVHLKRVESEPTDVTWQISGKPGGVFATRLVITPHGRDFNYEATGGTFKMPFLPDQRLAGTYLTITKTLLTLHRLDLTSATGDGRIHAQGTAGTRDDRSVDFTIELERVPIAEWLPDAWRARVLGEASGRIHWLGKDQTMAHAEGSATLRVEGGRILRLPALDNLAGVTGEAGFEHLELVDCSAEVTWKFPHAEIRQLVIEAKEKFRAEGTVRLEEKKLSGVIEFGVARELLDWLPHPETVFTRAHDGYLWTTVQLSGTLDAPQQDLSPRIMEAIKSEPGASIGAFFRQLGEWMESAFDGK